MITTLSAPPDAKFKPEQENHIHCTLSISTLCAGMIYICTSTCTHNTNSILFGTLLNKADAMDQTCNECVCTCIILLYSRKFLIQEFSPFSLPAHVGQN